MLNVAFALGTLSQHDGGAFRSLDMGRSQEGRGEHVDADAPFRGTLLELVQFVDRRITPLLILGFRRGADVLNAMSGEELKALLRGRPALTTQFHQNPLRARRRLGGAGRAGSGQHGAGGGGKDEVSAVHTI